jgi:hypothetical protein
MLEIMRAEETQVSFAFRRRWRIKGMDVFHNPFARHPLEYGVAEGRGASQVAGRETDREPDP